MLCHVWPNLREISHELGTICAQTYSWIGFFYCWSWWNHLTAARDQAEERSARRHVWLQANACILTASQRECFSSRWGNSDSWWWWHGGKPWSQLVIAVPFKSIWISKLKTSWVSLSDTGPNATYVPVSIWFWYFKSSRTPSRFSGLQRCVYIYIIMY